MTPTWESFLPGIVVLAVGLAAGLLLAARLRRTTPRAATSSPAAVPVDRNDLELELADLVQRRDALYTRLRADADEELDPTDRRELERAAARTLQRLDQLEARMPSRSRAPKRPAAPAEALARGRAGRPALHGFALGAGFAALAALLFYWVAGDATPRPPEPATTAAAPADEAIHDRLAELEPEARARVDTLLARLATAPEDLDARKALTETLVVEGLFYEAFVESERILEQSPGDADGLYFQGLIRLTMGQDDAAVELLDQALAREPGFVSALLVRGLARLRRGERDAAMEDWRRGLEAAGGSHQGLERLLAMAQAGASAEEILGSPAPGDATASTTAEGEPAALAGSEPASDAYRARIELAPGVTAPPGSILFVNLRIVAGAGPPSAVKRIDQPSFPLELTLDAGDAMPGLEGRPLPESGVVSARLDADGNASTRDPSEPSAQAEATLGVPLTLVLR